MQWQELPEMINGFKIIKDLGRVNGKTRKAIAECKVCQRHYEVQAYYLKDRKHCGCLRPKEMECTYRKSHPRLVTIYKCMRARCYYEKDINYKIYGARGIKVCDEWINKPDSFCYWALENGYRDNLSIDRINNELNYSPENCQWSDTKKQARNRKGIKLNMQIANNIREDSLTMTRKEISDKYSIKLAEIGRIIRNERWIK